MLEALRIPEAALPTIVDSSGVVGEAAALPGSPPIAGIAGDQQASLVGQGATRRGPGQGHLRHRRHARLLRGAGATRRSRLGARQGTFPIVAWRRQGRLTWGLEAIMLSAGTAVEWLRDDLGLIATAEESDRVAAACADTGDVWFVPALLGLGTPVWDFGARGTLVGITRGTGRAEVVRAVLEGVAHRGADLVEAAEADGDATIASLRVDGGMSANATFVQALADASGPAGRGLARPRGDDPGGRLPGRARPGHVDGRGRARRPLVAGTGGRAGAGRRPRSLAGGPRTGRWPPCRSCPASTSERPGTRGLPVRTPGHGSTLSRFWRYKT